MRQHDRRIRDDWGRCRCDAGRRALFAGDRRAGPTRWLGVPQWRSAGFVADLSTHRRALRGTRGPAAATGSDGMTIAFIDLEAQQARIEAGLRARLDKVLRHGKYIMGPEVQELETALAKFCGARFALGCANGTDALQLALMALGARSGDAVFCPSFTFASTAEVVPSTGATPVFVDVRPDTFNLDVESLKRAI